MALKIPEVTMDRDHIIIRIPRSLVKGNSKKRRVDVSKLRGLLKDSSLASKTSVEIQHLIIKELW